MVAAAQGKRRGKEYHVVFKEPAREPSENRPKEIQVVFKKPAKQPRKRRPRVLRMVLTSPNSRASGKAKVRPPAKAKSRSAGKVKQEEVFRYVRLGVVPKRVPDGLILVHNHVRRIHPAHPTGLNGFRAWYATPEEQYVPCDCGWAAEVPGGHYRVDFAKVK